MTYRESEYQARRDLAACYRLAYLRGWNRTTFNHISARLPDEPSVYLLNPFPAMWDEITPESLIKVDEEGNCLTAGSDALVNRAGFIIHGAIHAARPDVNCVLHVHTAAGVAVSCAESGLLPLSGESLCFTDRIAYHDFEGIVLDIDERERLVGDLGDKPVMILRNHGLLIAGRTIPEAFSMMDTLVQACTIQLAAAAAGPLRLVSREVGLRTADQKFNCPIEHGGWGFEWPALLRWLARQDARQNGRV